MANTVGLGGNKPAPQQPAPQAVQGRFRRRRLRRPRRRHPGPRRRLADAAPMAAPSPGLFDNVLGKVGFGAKTDPTSIDYSERQKLAVPQTRDLPPPRPQPERQVTRSGGDEALTKPPGEYLQKVPGQDGQISGLREGDMSEREEVFRSVLSVSRRLKNGNFQSRGCCSGFAVLYWLNSASGFDKDSARGCKRSSSPSRDEGSAQGSAFL